MASSSSGSKAGLKQAQLMSFFAPKVAKSKNPVQSSTLVEREEGREQEEKEEEKMQEQSKIACPTKAEQSAHAPSESQPKKRRLIRSIDDDEDEEDSNPKGSELDKSSQDALLGAEAEPMDKEDTNKKPLSQKGSLSIDLQQDEAPQPSAPCSSSQPQPSTQEDDTTDVGGASKPVKETEYDPSKAKYHPVADACWAYGQPVPYLALSTTFSFIEQTTKRLEIVAILRNFLRSVLVLTPKELPMCVYMCTNQLKPAYEGLELGIGESILMKAVATATGRTLQQVRSDSLETGDIGTVAQQSRGKQKTLSFARQPAPLTVKKVFDKLTEIANMSGGQSQTRKVEVIQNLLISCRESEAKFIVRSLGGALRIGLAEQSVLTAIAHAATYTPPCQSFPPPVWDASRGVAADTFKARLDANVLTVKSVYCSLPNYDKILDVLVNEGLDQLPVRCTLTAGIPLKPMLAHPTHGVDEVFKRFEANDFVCEYKYDGERAQIHMTADGKISIYSRNSENNTSKYPDLISRMPKALKEGVQSFIIDCEAVAYDPKTEQILPFQVLSTRRKKDADEGEIVVQVCLFAFDLILLNDEPFVKLPLAKRREALQAHFTPIPGEFMFATALLTSDVDEIGAFLDQSLKGSCEGLMVKALHVDATYEIAKRSHSWLKLKKDYLDGIGDTLDLVVIGGWRGKGKRTGFYGGFLLACYEPENEEFQAICKIGTGFSDEDLKVHSDTLKNHVISGPKSYYVYDSSLEPDDWFDAACVWEVKAADLSISPRHKAAIGLVDPQKGISLRFPRFIKIREDKKPEMATSSVQVAEMYNSQELIKNNNEANKKFDDDEDGELDF